MQDAFLRKFAVLCAVCVSFVLILAKAYAWYRSGSVSLLSSLVDSLIDCFSSSLNLIAVYHAVKPADDNHRFGYAKAEALAAFVQSLFIFGSAIFIFKEAFEKFSHPHTFENLSLVVHVSILSLCLTAFLLIIQKWVIKKTNSLAVQADHAHYQTDFLINGGVLGVSLINDHGHFFWIDPLFGVFVGVYIIYASWKILKKSMAILMDRELPETDRRTISEIILSHKQVYGYHLLRTRSSGTGEFIQCHLELPGEMILSDAHEVALDLEKAIRVLYPNAEIILHQDPSHIDEEHRMAL